jgi:fibronectin-binding autotransporter adhesin
MAHQGWRKWFKYTKPSETTNRSEIVRRKRAPRLGLEALEDRTLLTATLSISAGGVATFTGSAVNNKLTLTLSGGTYQFSDSAEPIVVSGAGSTNFSGSNTGTVQGPAASLSAIVLSLGTGQDSLEIGPFDAPVVPLSADGSGNAGDTADVSAQGTGLKVGTAGDVSLTGFSYVGVNNAITTANGAVTLQSTGTLDLNAPVTASGNTLLTGQTINVNAVISTTPSNSGTSGNITLNAGGSLALNEDIQTGSATKADTTSPDTVVSGSVALTAGIGIRGPGAVTTGDASITTNVGGGADTVTSGSIALTTTGAGSNGGIALSAPGALETGNATEDDAVTNVSTVGSITLASATSIDNGTGGMLDVAFGAATIASSNVPGTLSATTTAGGSVAGEILISSATPLTLGPITTSGGNVAIATTTSQAPLTVFGAIAAGTGAVTLQTTGSNSALTISNKINAGNGGISLSATGDITLDVGALITDAGNFSAIADTDLDGSGGYKQVFPLGAANITISGAGVQISGPLTATGQATIISTPSASGNPTADDLGINVGTGGIVAPAGISLIAGASNAQVIVTAQILSAVSGPVQITAGAGVSILAPITAGGAFTGTVTAINAPNGQGAFMQNGLLQAGSVQIVAPSITIATVTSAGSVSLTTKGGSGTITIFSVTAGGDVTATANGSLPAVIVQGAGISTTGGISLSASGNNGGITASTQGPGSPLNAGVAGIQIQAVGFIALGAVTTTGPFTAVADSDRDGIGNYTQQGPVQAGSIDISGAGVTVTGNLAADGQINITSNPSQSNGKLMINGSITASQSGIALTVTGPQDNIQIGNSLTASHGGIVISSNDGVQAQAPITAGGALTVNAHTNPFAAGAFSGGAPIQAGSVSIAAATISQLATLSSTGAVTLTAQSSQNLTPTVTIAPVTAGGTVSITSTVIYSDAITTSGGITLTATGQQAFVSGLSGLQSPGVVLTAGAAGISIQSDSSITVAAATTSGPYTAIADFAGAGVGTYVQAGTVSAGNIAISGANVQLNGALKAAGQATITSTAIQPGGTTVGIGIASNSGGIVAPKGITLAATWPTQSITIFDVLTATSGPVQIQASNGVSVQGDITAGGAFTVNARTNPLLPGAYTGGGQIQAASIYIAAATINQSAAISSNGAVTLIAQSSQNIPCTVSLGPVTAGGAVSITSTVITMTGSITTSGGINLTAAGQGASVGGQQFFGIVLSAGAAGVSIQSAGGILVAMATTSGPFTAIADSTGAGIGSYFQSGTVTARNVVISGAGVQLNGAIKSSGLATLISTPVQQNFGPGTLFISSGSGGIVAAKGISLAATGAVANISIFDVLTAASGPIQIQASASVLVNGNVTAGGAYTVNAQTNPFVTGATYSQQGTVKAASVSIIAPSISVTGATNSAGTVSLTVQGFLPLITTGDITAGGAVNILATSTTSQASINVAGAGITTKGGISLTANGPQAMIGGSSQGGTATAPLTAGLAGIQIRSAGNASIDMVTTSGPYTASADADSDGQGQFSQLGSIIANNVAINGVGITLDGSITTTGQATLTSTLASLGTSSVLIEAGTGGISANKGIFLTNITPSALITIDDALTARSGPIQIQASGTITESANVTAGAAYTVNALAGVTAAAGTEYTQTGQVVAPSVSILAGTVVLSGTVTATGAVSLQAIQNSGSNITVNAGITANGNVVMTAGGQSTGTIILSAPVTSRTGTVALQALTEIFIAANVNALGAFTANANTNPHIGGHFVQNPPSTIHAAALTIFANSLFLSGNLSTTGSVTLAGSLMLDNANIAAGSSSQVTISSDVTAAGNSRIAGNLYLGNQTRTFTTTGATDQLTVTGTVSGVRNVGVVEFGSGTLSFQGKDTYTGPTVLNGGTLLLSSTQATSSVKVNAGATLAGTGAVSQIVVSGGTLSPGQPGTVGILATTGAVTFGLSPSNVVPTFTVQLNSTTNDLLKAGGAVDLGGAALNIVLGNNFTHVPGKKFTILMSAGLTGALTSGGIPLNGTTVTVGAVQFIVNNVGNSVVLTEV